MVVKAGYSCTWGGKICMCIYCLGSGWQESINSTWERVELKRFLLNVEKHRERNI
jgi:hypothetical protein